MLVLALFGCERGDSHRLAAQKAAQETAQVKPIKTETVVLGGGCFWGVEELIRKLDGVIETEVGYAGGDLKDPTYPDVKTGRTGHAEVIKILFDPAKLTFETLLDYFFKLHDPTTLNRQGNDTGTQYRSVIFAQNDEQKKIALEKIRQVNASGKWKKPLVTAVAPVTAFYSAEEYHQDYLQKNPGGYTCHFLRK